jgi:8-amino-7-oxononanoate synthase
MAFPFVNSRSKTILSRCVHDEATRARLKYQPWYLKIDKQEGVRVWVDGQEMLMMSSNDYLGMSRHPRVIDAAQRAIRQWGTSTTGARLANGSRAYHCELEDKLAAFLGMEACHLHSAGYLSCMSAVTTFASKGDLILVDRNVHSSLWSGIGLSAAKVERFGHNDAADLAHILDTENKQTPKMLVLEGVYSMEGHIAPLPAILNAARGHDCFVVVDDAHGFGVLGPQGRGTCAHFESTKDVNIICGSLSKSLGSIGGFVAGSRDIIEYMRTHSKQTIFSAAVTPSAAATAGEALHLMQSEPSHIERLWDNTRYYKQLLKEIGADIWDSETPAVPILLGSRERAYTTWKTLLRHGIFTVPAIAPAVPPRKDLIRTAVTSLHTRTDLERVAEVLQKCLRSL